MTKGYVVFTEAVHDQAGIEADAAAAGQTVIAAGGTALVAGPPAEVVEGQ